MPNLPLKDAIEVAFRQYGAEEYEALAELSDEILRRHPDNFEATYFRGLAAIGAGDPIVGHSYIQRAETLFPKITEYNFLDPWMRHKGSSERAILYQRLALADLFQKTDSFLISYPKCGRTWVHFMLGTYALAGAPGNPFEVSPLSCTHPELTSIEISHDDFPQWKPWTDIVEDKHAYKDKRVIFLARDPRDAIVSYYFEYTLRGSRLRSNHADFGGDIAEFIRQDIGGLKSLLRFYNAWAASRSVPRQFNLITYEDLHRDTHGVLKETLAFLDWPDYGDQAVAEAVAAGKFENMRRLEEQNTFDNYRLRAPEDGNPEGFKIRRGVVGGFKDYLSDEDVAWVNNLIKEELDDFFERYKYESR